MIKIENVVTPSPEQWERIIYGMRNPKNSYDRYDSEVEYESPHDMSGGNFIIGPNDHDLMMRLAKGGPVHAKYRRMIVVYADITAPLYWWKEADQSKVGTVTNSCSTMHKIHAKEFTMDDFSCEHLKPIYIETLSDLIDMLNVARENYLTTKDKDDWWQMIQLLPSSYNQKRTIMLNYEVLTAMYQDRKYHKLDCWRDFCKWIETLPYSEIITGTE